MSTIIYSEDEEARSVIGFDPKPLGSRISKTAEDFAVSVETQGTKFFQVDELVLKQTGIDKLKLEAAIKKLEQEAHIRLKGIQEESYKKAYALGLEEGRKKGFEDSISEIHKGLESLEGIFEIVLGYKKDILERQIRQIIDLVGHVASSLAFEQIEMKEDKISSVLKKVIESVDAEEKVTVKISAADKRTIESLIENSDFPKKIFQKITFEVSESVDSGGCIVDTNYGAIDATLQERIKRMWEILEEKKPGSEEDNFGE